LDHLDQGTYSAFSSKKDGCISANARLVFALKPFGGSFAVSRKLYKDTNKYNFHINDSDPDLCRSFKHYQDYINIITELDNDYNQESTYK
jgi:hypothetical protein